MAITVRRMMMMNRRGLNSIVVLILIMAMIQSCEKLPETDDDQEHEDPSDYTWDATTVVRVTLNGSSITVVPPVATVSGSNVTIKSVGTYSISGSLSDGQIIVNSGNKGSVRLLLTGVNIKCSNSAPVFIKDSDKTIILLEKDTENYLTDGTTYVTEDGEPNAAIFSNSDLTIYGEGSLTVNANYNDGISSDDGLLIKSGTITVNAKDDGIRGKDYLLIRDGKITVNAKGDGLKSDNEEDASKGYISVDYGIINITSTGDGVDAATNLAITDGIFTITTSGGGTSSSGGGFTPPGGGGGGTSGGYSGSISAKGLKGVVSLLIKTGTFTINSADDAIHSNGDVTIDNGTFNIASGDDAIHADASITINDGTINTSKSYEGMEASSIIVNKGIISMVASDDALNATRGNRTEANDGSSISINGGNVTVNSTKGDGLDSNGNATITGGTVIIHGPQSQPEVGFDINGTFNLSGGFFIATGPNSGNMIEVPSTSSAQYSVKVTFSSTLSSSTLFHIQDAGGNEIVTFKPVRNVYYIVFSSPDLKSGSSYSVYTGGSSTGTFSEGLYVGGTYSGGTMKKTFTISNKITTVSL
jgi:hypothetical protein